MAKLLAQATSTYPPPLPPWADAQGSDLHLRRKEGDIPIIKRAEMEISWSRTFRKHDFFIFSFLVLRWRPFCCGVIRRAEKKSLQRGWHYCCVLLRTPDCHAACRAENPQLIHVRTGVFWSPPFAPQNVFLTCSIMSWRIYSVSASGFRTHTPVGQPAGDPLVSLPINSFDKQVSQLDIPPV